MRRHNPLQAYQLVQVVCRGAASGTVLAFPWVTLEAAFQQLALTLGVHAMRFRPFFCGFFLLAAYRRPAAFGIITIAVTSRRRQGPGRRGTSLLAAWGRRFPRPPLLTCRRGDDRGLRTHSGQARDGVSSLSAYHCPDSGLRRDLSFREAASWLRCVVSAWSILPCCSSSWRWPAPCGPGYLVRAADNGQNAGPLIVQDVAAEADLQQLIHSVKDNNTFVSPAPLADAPEETAHASPGYPYLVGWTARLVVPANWIDGALGPMRPRRPDGRLIFSVRSSGFSLSGGRNTGRRIVRLASVLDRGYRRDQRWDLGEFSGRLIAFRGVRARQTGGPFASLLYGLALAGAALVRAALLPFAFVGLAWFLLHSRRMPSGWLGALLAFLGFVIGLAPWTIRNWQVFNEPIPIVDSAYLHFWMGNNPAANGGPVPSKS